MPIGISIPNSPITTVDIELGALISRDPAPFLDVFLLRIKDPGGLARSRSADCPLSVPWIDMQAFRRHFTLRCSLPSTWKCRWAIDTRKMPSAFATQEEAPPQPLSGKEMVEGGAADREVAD